MGCDIHMYVEYKNREEGSYYCGFGKRINPGRNYALFGLLCKGVRSNDERGIVERGLPPDTGWSVNEDEYFYIGDSEEERYVSLEKAKSWENDYCRIINDSNGKPYKVMNPDWHSHSWLTYEEFQKQYDIYLENNIKWREVEYEALLAAMKVLALEHDCRVVFWFDN